MHNLPSHLPSLLKLVNEVSIEILRIYRQAEAFSVDFKSDKSPVTEADKISNDMIVQALTSLMPNIPVISEESAVVPFEERQHWQKLWLVDPLDGTREFIAKTDDFSINLALVENHQPIFGLIHVPVTGVTYYAFKNQQAIKRMPDGTIQPLHVRHLNRNKPIIIASRRHGLHSPLQRLFDFVGEYEKISRGSALKFGLIAEGLADLYPRFGETYEWDTAAGQCILETAGGHVVDIQMQPLRYNMRPSLLNPHFFAMGDGLEFLKHWSQSHGK